MLSEYLVPIAVVLAAVLILTGVVVARRRRPSGRQGASRMKDFEAIERAGRTAIETPSRVEEPAEPPAEPAAAEAPPAEKPEAGPRPTLRERLVKSRRFFAARLSEAFGGSVDEDTWEDLEAALI